MKTKQKTTNTTKTLATGIFVGGMIFSGATDAADVVVNGGFEDSSGWSNIGTNYSHPYGGIRGPQLPEVGTLNDYGYFDNLSASAGGGFHGLAYPSAQTVSLVSADLTANQILAGNGRFAFSAWMAACCNDTPKLTLAFNDAANTTVVFNRGITTHMITSVDVLVNPGGPNNTTSLDVVNDASRRYWALYEFKGTIPADATQATLTLTDGRADASAAGANTGGNGNDNYADMVILDTVAESGDPFPVDISYASNTDELQFQWESQNGKVYDLRSSTDPEADGDPETWTIVPGQEGLAATPPTNTRTIARPGDNTRIYVIQERNAPPPPPVFFDDFESVPNPDWTVGTNGGDAGTTVWERGSPTNVGPTSGYDGSSNCFGTNISANYTLNTDIWLRSPPINLGGGITGATLSFKQHRDTDFDVNVDDDYGTIRVLKASDLSQLGEVIVTDVEGFDFDGNNNPIWADFPATSLPAQAIGEEVVLEFRFKTDNDFGVFSGWYIDDVIVEVE